MSALRELTELVERHTARGIAVSAVDGLDLVRAEAITGRFGALYQPSLCVVLQGAKTTLLGEQVFNYDAGKYLIASVDLPAIGQIAQASPEAPYLALRLSLDTAVVAELLLDAEDEADAPPAPGLAVSELSDDLADALLRLTRLIERPREIAALAPLIKREILYRLLFVEVQPLLRQIGRAGSRLNRLNRALAWIRQNYDAPLKVGDLARLAHMSPSTFHRQFKAVTALSPLQYQKQIRLQEARRRLLADEADVASVGLAVGYESPSQFSREYRRLFGAPPGRDAVQLRESVRLSAGLAGAEA